MIKVLHGREREQRELRGVLADAAEGYSAALLIVAEPGGGKSALLRWAAEQATARREGGLQVLRCTGVQTESELPFAGLQLLLSPVLSFLDALPELQAEALRAAFGLAPPGGADRFLVGLATLSLLSELSAGEPVLCLVDDAQWLDQPSAEALLFAARRLAVEGVVLLLAAREEFSAPGLPELRMDRLGPAAARDLLAEHAPDLPSHFRERVLAEADGNPLALLELPRTDLDPLSVGPLPLPRRLQEAYQRRIAELPDTTRTALVAAAADETGDLATVLRVMTRLGLAADVLALAEDAGLVTVSDQSIVFCHPLIRAAAYQAAPFPRRVVVHAALADAVAHDLDRSAWHRAAAAIGADEAVAAGLEAAADRARGRAGYATAVSALERSARLTPETAVRARRLVAAVETAADAGQFDRARHLADQAGPLTGDPWELARLAGVRARMEFERGSLRAAHDLLVPAAANVVSLAPDLAAAMLLDAVRAAWTGGDRGRAEQASKKLLELPHDPVREALIRSFDGGLRLHSDDAAAGEALLREHVALGRKAYAGRPALLLNVGLQALLASDFDDARDIMLELAGECRTGGMIGWLPAVLSTLARAETMLGRFRDAAASAAEGLRIAEDTDQPTRISLAEGVLAFLAAVGGDEERCRELAERNRHRSGMDFNPVIAAWCEWAMATLDLGKGRYEAALDRLEAAAREPLGFVGNAVHMAADQVEAAARLGRPERAAEPLARLARWTGAIQRPWADAVLLRCQGLLGGDGAAFARAAGLHTESGRPFDLARTELLHGEWLRRERGKTEARPHLRAALETFHRLGAVPFAEYARAELRAAGESTVPKADAGFAARLTPQELQVVRLAATGATNKEIGAQLFLSPKTVGHHLYRAFPKLGVSTRTELARLALT